MRTLLLLCWLTVVGAGEAKPPSESAPPALPQITVVVTEFQNRHPLLDQDWLASACADLVASALATGARDVSSGITVLDRSAIAAIDQEGLIARDGGKAQGALASHVLGGSFTVIDDRLTLEVALTTDGQQRWTQRLEGTTEQLPVLARRIAAGALTTMSARVTLPTAGASRTARDLPLAALVTFQRGRAAAARGDHAWAVADLLRTCKLAPQYGEAWLALGSSLEALGRPAAALVAWEQAIAVDPDDPGMSTALFRLARATEERPAHARRLYERLIQEYPYSPAPADLVGAQHAGSSVTVAALAANRLALLGDSVAAPVTTSAGNAAAAKASAAAGASAGAPVADLWLRRLRLITDVRARTQSQVPTEDEYLLRLALLSAAGGWPSDWPVVRLSEGKPAVARLSYAGFGVAPPPGMVIENLTVTAVAKPGMPTGQYRFSLATHSIADANSNGNTLCSSKDGEPVTIAVSPTFASGFSATGVVQLSGQPSQSDVPLADLHLSATLRAAKPGALWIVTQPPGALITIDGHPRGITPCRIGDLAPGSLRVLADSQVIKSWQGSDRPIQDYLRFSDEATIEVATTGETRVEWTLTHRPKRPADGWSDVRLAFPAPLGVEVPGVTRPEHENPTAYRPQALLHEQLGVVLGWSVDGDLRIGVSRDTRTWKMITNLPANSGAEESLAVAAVSPQGQILLVFRRGVELWSITTTDLVTWTQPVRIAEVSDDDYQQRGRRHVAGAVWSAVGQWVIVYQRKGSADYYTATSSDGRGWSTTPTPLVPPVGWSPDRGLLLHRFSDGTPSLYAIARVEPKKHAMIARFTLGSKGWEMRDQSPPFDLKRTNDVSAGLLASEHDHSIHLVTRSGTGVRWVVGGDLHMVDGLCQQGNECAITAAPEGPLLVIPWAGSWWVANAGSTQTAMPLPPTVTYEIPKPAVTATSKTIPPASAAPAALAPSSTPTQSVDVLTQPAVGDTTSARPMAAEPEKTRRGRSPLIIVLVLGVLGLTFTGICWWWWGFLRRRRAEQQS